MIFMACSYFMPVPLVSYQPEPKKNIPKVLKKKEMQIDGNPLEEIKN